MKVTFIGHASLLIESKGISVLSDPWWRGPCFGAQWWNRPAPCVDTISKPPDYIYISHGHEDHFHVGTLKTFSRETTMLVSSQLQLAQPLSELGFKVVEVSPDSPLELGEGVRVRIWQTHGGDSLFVLEEGEEVVFNLNDALHSVPRATQDRHIEKLNSMFPEPDYVFCGYGIASHFPNCYFIPSKNDALTAARRQSYFNAQWAYIMHALRPRFGFPFAANVVFFEKDLIALNEAVHNFERPTERYVRIYREATGELIDIAPGFQIESRKILANKRFVPTNMNALLETDTKASARANRYSVPDADELNSIVDLLRRNIQKCLGYLIEHRGDYRFGILIRGGGEGFSITKRGNDVEAMREGRTRIEASGCNVIFETRAVYLRRSLQEDFADEVLFVGSGGVFRYLSREDANRNLHRELMTILRKHDRPPASRFGDDPRWLYQVKRLVKWLLRIQPEDLYDLKRWIVYD